MKTQQFFTHTPTPAETLEQIRQSIPDFLKEKRLNHTFFVEKEAKAIAEIVFLVYNISDRYMSDVSAAALLHDITKQTSLESQLEMCARFGIAPGVSPSCEILHGKTAAFLAREKFGINDFVFSAVFNHTTGKENMNPLDKIIFLADFIEPSRTHESCIRTREFFYGSVRNGKNPAEALDNAIIMSIDSTLSHLIEADRIIDIQTVLARNCLLNQKKL